MLVYSGPWSVGHMYSEQRCNLLIKISQSLIDFLGLRLRRQFLLEDSLKNFQFVTDSTKRMTVEIHFSKEEGIDAGNSTKLGKL
mgnify:CR=1 FL=1